MGRIPHPSCSKVVGRAESGAEIGRMPVMSAVGGHQQLANDVAPVLKPAVQAAKTADDDSAAKEASPGHGSAARRQLPLVKRAAATAPRLFTTIHPVLSCSTRLALAAGPAPSSSVVDDKVNASDPTGLTMMWTDAGPPPSVVSPTTWTRPAEASSAKTENAGLGPPMT